MKIGKTFIASILAVTVIAVAAVPFGSVLAEGEHVQAAGSSPLLSAPHILPPL